MELKQFIHTLQQDPALRRLLPINQGMLYPCFTLCEGKLCAHFLTHASSITPEGMVLYPPAYHVAALYPQGSILCVENLRCNPGFQDVDFAATTLVTKPGPEEKQQRKAQIARLKVLADRVLADWDETGTADFTAYHSLLQEVLTSQQTQLYGRVTG